MAKDDRELKILGLREMIRLKGQELANLRERLRKLEGGGEPKKHVAKHAKVKRPKRVVSEEARQAASDRMKAKWSGEWSGRKKSTDTAPSRCTSTS